MGIGLVFGFSFAGISAGGIDYVSLPLFSGSIIIRLYWFWSCVLIPFWTALGLHPFMFLSRQSAWVSTGMILLGIGLCTSTTNTRLYTNLSFASFHPQPHTFLSTLN